MPLWIRYARSSQTGGCDPMGSHAVSPLCMLVRMALHRGTITFVGGYHNLKYFQRSQQKKFESHCDNKWEERCSQASQVPKLSGYDSASCWAFCKDELDELMEACPSMISPALWNRGCGPLQSITTDLCCSSVMAIHKEVIVPSWMRPWRLAALRNLTHKIIVNC